MPYGLLPLTAITSRHPLEPTVVVDREQGCPLPAATSAPETRKSKKRVCGWWERVPTVATQILLTNAVQPASEPVLTSTPYQTQLFKGLAGLRLPLLSFLTGGCSLAKVQAFLQVLMRRQTLALQGTGATTGLEGKRAW